MRQLRAIFLLTLFSLVLAHAAVPHHHDVPESVAVFDHHGHKHEHEHHHDQNGGHTSNAQDDNEAHNVFSFTNIDTTFLSGKQVDLNVLFIYEYIPTFSYHVFKRIAHLEYFDQDPAPPPLIFLQTKFFRGPPLL
jgi:hypothetical protein